MSKKNGYGLELLRKVRRWTSPSDGRVHFHFCSPNIAASNSIVSPPFYDLSAYTIDSIIWPTDLSRNRINLIQLRELTIGRVGYG